MPFFHKIDKERKLVMSTVAGELTKDEVLTLQDQLRKDPDFDPNLSQLSDLTHVTAMNITGAEMQELAERTAFSPKARRAVIASNDPAFGLARMFASGDLAFGLARMFETLRGLKGEGGIHIFREKEEALNWVLGKGKGA
jgi:hypothetical protein